MPWMLCKHCWWSGKRQLLSEVKIAKLFSYRTFDRSTNENFSCLFSDKNGKTPGRRLRICVLWDGGCDSPTILIFVSLAKMTMATMRAFLLGTAFLSTSMAWVSPLHKMTNSVVHPMSSLSLSSSDETTLRVLGVCGGIGSGKSYACRFLVSNGKGCIAHLGMFFWCVRTTTTTHKRPLTNIRGGLYCPLGVSSRQ